MAASTVMPQGQSQTCDICDEPIVPGDRCTDDGSEVCHKHCVDHWFRTNFGREILS